MRTGILGPDDMLRCFSNVPISKEDDSVGISKQSFIRSIVIKDKSGLWQGLLVDRWGRRYMYGHTEYFSQAPRRLCWRHCSSWCHAHCRATVTALRVSGQDKSEVVVLLPIQLTFYRVCISRVRPTIGGQRPQWVPCRARHSGFNCFGKRPAESRYQVEYSVLGTLGGWSLLQRPIRNCDALGCVRRGG